MRIKFLGIFSLLLFLELFSIGCGGQDEFQDRGKYIYDDADRLSVESEISLASYLWKLDSKTSYEVILFFPKEQMDEQAIIDWFNSNGIGKKNIDNGAAIFVFPDSTVFVAIGSGNDKVSVSESKTHGERIFEDFNNDPVLTLLRFTSVLGGKVDESSSTEIGEVFFETLKNNLSLILLWAAVLALLLFLIQQFNGFQLHDLILPIAVFIVLGLFFGISALSSSVSVNYYKTYGVITSSKTGSYNWVHTHTICTSTGKTTICTSHPHIHTMYTNDVNFLSYEFKKYSYRYQTDEYRGAWNHPVGELDALTLDMKNEALAYVSGINDNSGGKTIGDGVWITSGKKK